MAIKKPTNNTENRLKEDSISGYFGYKDVGGKEQGRISNALSSNLAIRKQLNLFDYLDEEQQGKLSLSDQAHYVDRKGKTISLAVEDIQIIKALSSYLPFNDPEIKAFITSVNTMNAKGELQQTPKSPIQIPISILQLSKDIIGDTKEASLRKIGERVKRLAELQQAQTFYLDGGEKYVVVRPLILLGDQLYKCYSEVRSTRGRKKDKDPDVKEDKLLIGANIIYSSLFLYEATNKYCPLYTQKLFEVWRGNKTEIFAILLADLESKWRQYYIASVKAENAAKRENKALKATDREEYNRLVTEAKARALVYTSSTLTIRDRVATDYESKRNYRARFIPDLQRAINSLVEYGIITDKSHIAKDNSNTYFCYNPNFVPKEDLLLLPPEETEK